MSIRIFLLSLALATAFADVILPQNLKPSSVKNEIQNAYAISVQVLNVTLPASSVDIYIKFYGKNISFVPYQSLTTTDVFDDTLVIGMFATRDEVLNFSSEIGFQLYSAGSDELLLSVNLTSEIAQNFPNTSAFNPLDLWPDESFSSSASYSLLGITAEYTVQYKGVLEAFGDIELNWPVWKIFVVVAAAKLAFVSALSAVDFCCQPLQLASGATKLGIFFGNALWLFFGGLVSGVVYLLGGIVLCLTLVLAPFGLKLIRYSIFSLFPFGREIRTDESAGDLCSCLGNVLWLVFLGIPLVLFHALLGIVLCLLIVTIPFGLQHFKLAKFALMPFGHTPVFREDLKRGEEYEKVGFVVYSGPRYV